MHNWNTFDAQMSHMQTHDSQNSPQPRIEGNHHLPPYSILCACQLGQHPNVILSWDSQVGVPKFSKLGFLQL